MATHISHACLPYPIKHARYTVLVPFLDSSGAPTDPTSPDTQLSTDGGVTFSAATEEVTTGGGKGGGMFTFTGADANNSGVFANFGASGPEPTLMTIYPRELTIVASGTLSAGSAGGGTLGGALAYNVAGCFLRTTGGTGGGGTGGANNQARKIITYTTTTGVFTVAPNWETTPSTDTTYDVLAPEGVTLEMILGATALDVSTPEDVADAVIAAIGASLITTLTAHGLGIGRGVVDAGSSTTALVIKTVNGAAASAVNDFYKGRHVVFTSGALLLQAASITAYVGATKTATVSALTGTPAEDVTFIIV